MKIVIFEDHRAEQFYPFSELHAVYDLPLGFGRVGERIIWHLLQDRTPAGVEVEYLTRPELAELNESTGFARYTANETDTLFVNARLWKTDWTRIVSLPAGAGFTADDGSLIAFRLAEKDSLVLDESGFPQADNLHIEPLTTRLLQFPWDLFLLNSQAIQDDFQLVGPYEPHREFSARILQPENVRISHHTKIHPHVVIDGSSGPVYIEEGVEIWPFTYIQGPVYLGPDVLIKSNSTIYDGTSIGERCKVAGEVENSLLHSFANKQHQGFLGHSVLMPFTNLGADSNNSDLKNNYGSVRVSQRGKQVDTGEQFVGLLMGDHAKTAINTQFNTGTVVGIFANVFGSGFPPKEIAPFAWGGFNQDRYDLEKALDVARRVMARRDQTMTASMESRIRALAQQD